MLEGGCSRDCALLCDDACAARSSGGDEGSGLAGEGLSSGDSKVVGGTGACQC